MSVKRAICFLLLLSGCDSLNPPLDPATIDISNTGYSSPVLNLKVRIMDVHRDGDLLRQAGTVVLDVGRDLAAGNPPVRGRLDTINFVFFGPSITDDQSESKFVHLSYDVLELRSLAEKTDGNPDTILGSAEEGGTWAPANDDVVHDYCRTYGEGDFCLRLTHR